MRSSSHALVLAFLALAAAPLQAQSVLVVDVANGPGAQFTDLSDAVNAAAAGDILLVRDGTYADSLALGSKSLTVTASPFATVFVPTIVVDGAAAGVRIVVHGIHALGGDVNGIECRSSAGAILIEGCQSHSGAGAGADGGAIAIEDCANVVLHRVVVTNPAGASVPAIERRGLTCRRSRVSAFECYINGGGRTGLGDVSVTPGAAGALVEDSTVLFQGTVVQGGDGADRAGVGGGCHGASGGDGVVVLRSSSATDSIARSIGSSFLGGAAGIGPCGSGQAGVPVQVLSGTYSVPSNVARSANFEPFQAFGTPVREGQPMHLRVGGFPGERVFVRLSLAHGNPLTGPRFLGTSLLGPTLFRTFLTQILPQGNQVVELPPIAELGPGIQALEVYAQTIHVGAGHVPAFGPLTSLTVLDRAIP